MWKVVRSIPWDVCTAATLAAAIAIISLADDPLQTVFVAVFFGSCAYVALEAFGDK
jgi:hypothetical protein